MEDDDVSWIPRKHVKPRSALMQKTVEYQDESYLLSPDDDDDADPPESDANGDDIVSERQIELDALELEYREKLEILEIWKAAEEKAIYRKYKKRKRIEIVLKDIAYHTFHKSQFSVANGRAACSAISLIAVYNFLRLKSRNLEKISWTKVVEMGAIVWSEWMRDKNDKHPGDFRKLRRTYQDVIEAYGVSTINQVREVIRIKREINGHLDSAKIDNCQVKRDVYDLSYLNCSDDEIEESTNANNADEESEDDAIAFATLEGVIALLKSDQKDDTESAATITIRENTVSVFYDRKFFWLFDSHGGREPGKSTLVECKTAESLCNYIRYKYPIEKIYDYELYENKAKNFSRIRKHVDINTFFFVLFVRK